MGQRPETAAGLLVLLRGARRVWQAFDERARFRNWRYCRLAYWRRSQGACLSTVA